MGGRGPARPSKMGCREPALDPRQPADATQAQPTRPRQPRATGAGRPAYATMAVPRLPITSCSRAMSITFLASTRVGTSMRRRSPALLTT